MERLARIVIRRRKIVIGLWLALTFFGAYSAARVSNRWLESVLDPGLLGVRGEPADAEDVRQRRAVRRSSASSPRPGRDVTKVPGVAKAFAQAAAREPGRPLQRLLHDARRDVPLAGPAHGRSRRSSRRAIQGFDVIKSLKPTRATLKRLAPAGTTAYLTGHDPLYSDVVRRRLERAERPARGDDRRARSARSSCSSSSARCRRSRCRCSSPSRRSSTRSRSSGRSRTSPTSRSSSQFLIALVGLGIAIDYALLMIFRFREELRHGNDVETSLVTTMTHAGRSVIVSGSTVAVGLLSMLVLPLPFIRSIGIGGMLIPAVSVLAAITLLPAMLAVLGTAHQQRARAAEAARRRLGRRVGRLLEPLVALRHAAAAHRRRSPAWRSSASCSSTAPS